MKELERVVVGYKPWNDDYPAPWNKQEIDEYNQEYSW